VLARKSNHGVAATLEDASLADAPAASGPETDEVLFLSTEAEL
jgi:hypothetical protein